MRTLSTVFLALASLHALTGLAAPAAESLPEPKPAKPNCVVPAVVFTTLEKKFSLTALISPYSYVSRSWPVQVSPRTPSAKTVVEPIISRTKIAQPLFELKDGKLIYEGFPAQGQLTILPFPLPLQSFIWGGLGEGSIEFYAVYSCDARGNQILELLDGLPGTGEPLLPGNPLHVPIEMRR